MSRIIDEDQVPKKGFDKALQLLREGKIEINEKTGKPKIKDLMDKAQISRSYAFKARRKVEREEKAKEQPLTSEVEVVEVKAEAKPRLKPKPEPEREELVAEPEKPLTYADVLEELQDFEDMVSDAYMLVFGPEGATATFLGAKYHRPEKSCKRMARNWTRYLKHRIDPETLEGYDTYILVANHFFFALPLGITWLRDKQEQKRQEKKEAK